MPCSRLHFGWKLGIERNLQKNGEEARKRTEQDEKKNA